jgi:hypothetical protein
MYSGYVVTGAGTSEVNCNSTAEEDIYILSGVSSEHYFYTMTKDGIDYFIYWYPSANRWAIGYGALPLYLGPSSGSPDSGTWTVANGDSPAPTVSYYEDSEPTPEPTEYDYIFDFAYEPIEFQTALDAFNLIRHNFYYAPIYCNNNRVYLEDVLGLNNGVVYGLVPTVTGNSISITEGLVICNGKLYIPASNIGVKLNTNGYVIVDIYGFVRCVTELPSEPHVVLFTYTHTAGILSVDTSSIQRTIQYNPVKIECQLTEVFMEIGESYVYTITHAEKPLSLPGFVEINEVTGYATEFIKDSETEISFQIVISNISATENATFDIIRTGIGNNYSWYQPGNYEEPALETYYYVSD